MFMFGNGYGAMMVFFITLQLIHFYLLSQGLKHENIW